MRLSPYMAGNDCVYEIFDRFHETELATIKANYFLIRYLLDFFFRKYMK
jgi:hypothetical protein